MSYVSEVIHLHYELEKNLLRDRLVTRNLRCEGPALHLSKRCRRYLRATPARRRVRPSPCGSLRASRWTMTSVSPW
jgi:hypothetical protein